MNGYLDKGIYGIYVEDELVYVGLTSTSFFSRHMHHQDKLRDLEATSQRDMYAYLRQALTDKKSVSMRPIIALEDLTLSYGATLTRRDLNIMEMTCIAIYKPRFNKIGLITNYQFEAEGADPIFSCSRYTPGYTKLLLESNWKLELVL